MERDQIPVIGLQISLAALLVLGIFWIYDLLPSLFERKNEFYISFGAVVVVLSPVFSQIVYSIWKIFFGFQSYDITRELCACVYSPDCRQKIQIAFDNFWHNSDNVNDNIIKYSRTRSVVCQMNLFASKILAAGSIAYLIIAFIKSLDTPDYSIWKALTLFFVTGVISFLFDKHFEVTSRELIETERKYILSASLEKKDEKVKSGFKSFSDDFFQITDKDLTKILEHKINCC